MSRLSVPSEIAVLYDLARNSTLFLAKEMHARKLVMHARLRNN